ncbi:hypothetical protein ACIGKG_06340 [Streptomyces rochei]|uniref:hypothetical protein n=1 Tax=Streptomyces rochei TaxID=1928 RepID=UPI0037CF678C
MTASIDAHVRLDTHPTHPSAVQAVLTGTQARVASTALEAVGWSAAATCVMVLARIDHEEPYWAADAAQHLTVEGITVEITPRLQLEAVPVYLADAGDHDALLDSVLDAYRGQGAHAGARFEGHRRPG